MLSTFTWYANYHFNDNDERIRQNDIFSKISFKMLKLFLPTNQLLKYRLKNYIN